MKIKTKVTFKEYAKLLYKLTYNRPLMKLLVGVALILLLWIVFYYLEVLNLPKPIIYQYITLALIVVAQPLVILSTIYNIYYSSNQISEPLEMALSPKEIKIKGNSFYMVVEWEKFYKIEERRNWFLLYQNKLSAIIIPKKELSTNEIAEIKGILKGIVNVKVQLRKRKSS